MIIISISNVIGPIMIGPSSSHTAGASRIGNFAHNYIGGTPSKVDFFLHGSFATTYIGHGTDKALLGGIMGFQVSDERIRNSFEIAKNMDISFNFIPKDLGNVHPNTVRIEAFYNNQEFIIEAASVGAGEIIINKLDDNDVCLNGKTPTLYILNKDEKGALEDILKIISSNNINISSVSLNRISKYLKEASCIIELDDVPTVIMIQEIISSKFVKLCKYIPKI